MRMTLLADRLIRPGRNRMRSSSGSKCSRVTWNHRPGPQRKICRVTLLTIHLKRIKLDCISKTSCRIHFFFLPQSTYSVPLRLLPTRHRSNTKLAFPSLQPIQYHEHTLLFIASNHLLGLSKEVRHP